MAFIKHRFGTFIFAATCLGSASCTGDVQRVDADNSLAQLLGTPPDQTPVPIAPGLVSTDDLEGLPAFSPDMRELYFIRQGSEGPSGYRVLRKLGDNLAVSEVETTDKGGEVFISPDGETMFLGNEYRDRREIGWSPLKSMGSPFDGFDIMRLTASADGMIVFDERDEHGKLRYASLIDGQYEAPTAFGPEINTGTYVAHPFIASDGSYLIFDAIRDGGYGGSDLYIAFRARDGGWTEVINLGEKVNSPADDIFGSVTPDGSALIFQRVDLEQGQSDIFWVGADEILALQPSASAK